MHLLYADCITTVLKSDDRFMNFQHYFTKNTCAERHRCFYIHGRILAFLTGNGQEKDGKSSRGFLPVKTIRRRRAAHYHLLCTFSQKAYIFSICSFCPLSSTTVPFQRPCTWCVFMPKRPSGIMSVTLS